MQEWVRELLETAKGIEEHYEQTIENLKNDLDDFKKNEAAKMILDVDFLSRGQSEDARKEIFNFAYWQLHLSIDFLSQVIRCRKLDVCGYVGEGYIDKRCNRCKGIFSIRVKSFAQGAGKYICDNCETEKEKEWKAMRLADEERLAHKHAMIPILKAMPYSQYLQTEHWKKVAEEARRFANYKCQLCNSDEKLNVHHRHYRTRGHENALTDLIVLCEHCHAKFHDKLSHEDAVA